MRLIIVAAVALLLTGCFTGIESTPRITGADVRSSGAGKTSDEAVFAARIHGDAPSAWKPGKQWHVTSDRISLIFQGQQSADSLPGSLLTLKATMPIQSVTGGSYLQLVLADADGDIHKYITDVEMSELSSRSSLEIPFAIEMSAVSRADSLMRGHIYYITTPRWFDAEAKPVSEGLRHVPVRILRVEPGTATYPLKVAFAADGDSVAHYVMMTYGDSPASTRNFDVLFSFTNPRTRYPAIADATWQLITQSKIEAGMTRDECRLALGAPAQVVRTASTSAQIERWTYGDGVWLVFEDGILSTYRK